jgi:peptidoglycan hydrolase-like protein with peptidoglycan-binding domain
MGKLPASLLSIVFQLLLIASIFAEDDVRRVQQELHKRHLFYGNPNGQITPALTRAVAHYQEIKGFPRTGIIDFQTCASLGLVAPEPRIARTPFIVENSQSVRGANGEQLPTSLSETWMTDECAARIERALQEENHAVAALAGTTVETVAPDVVPAKRQAPHRPRRIQPQKERNPFVLALQTVDRALKYLRGDEDPRKKRTASKRL